MQPIDRVPGPQLRKMLAAAERVSSAHNENFILHGRGHWRFTDIAKAASEGDRSAKVYMQAAEYERSLRDELQRRMTYHGTHVPIKRKENPMATARKKAPTAAQKAARAEFSRIMKSGGFAKKRRAKNPVARSRASAGNGRMGRSRQSALDPTLSPSVSYDDGHSHGPVNNNPKRRAPMKVKRKANPTAMPLHYACHIATADGKAGRFLFAAKAKPDAVALAQAYASAKGKRVVIVGKAR